MGDGQDQAQDAARPWAPPWEPPDGSASAASAPASGYPPPPPGTATGHDGHGAGPQDGYQPAGPVARVVLALLAANAVVAGIAAAVDVTQFRIFTALVDDPVAVTADQLAAADLRQLVVVGTQLLLILATGVAFVIWLRRVYRNLEPLGAGDLRFAPGWAVGGWFVPVLNLWRPKQIVNDAWRASHPDLSTGSTTWHRARTPARLTVWWLLLLLSGAIVTSAGGLGVERAEDLRDASLAYLVADGIDVAAALAAMWVVSSLTARQEERAAARGYVPPARTMPMPAGGMLAAAAVAIALAGVGSIVFAPGMTGSGMPAAMRDDAGDVASRGVIPIEELAEGDCFQEPGAGGEGQEVFGAEVVPCDEPHDVEVLAATSFPAAPGEAYPGDDATFDRAVVLCDAIFTNRVAIGPGTAMLDLYILHPTRDGWTAGDREVLCGVYRIDGSALRAPVERSRADS